MINLLEPDMVAGEELTDADTVSVPSDAAVGADESGLEVAGVGDRLEGGGEGPWRGLIEIGGHGTVESLMGPDVVVLGAEAVEGTLLLTDTRGVEDEIVA